MVTDQKQRTQLYRAISGTCSHAGAGEDVGTEGGAESEVLHVASLAEQKLDQ